MWARARLETQQQRSQKNESEDRMKGQIKGQIQLSMDGVLDSLKHLLHKLSQAEPEQLVLQTSSGFYILS
jgi:hypothetical protein